jgi:ankyrin repeat protein
MMAAKKERISAERKTAMVDILLKANADLNTQENSTGWTALMFAVNKGHKDIVQRLVSAGADVHIRDKRGRSALSLALERGDVDVMKVLIEGGADVNTQNKAAMVDILLTANGDLNTQENSTGWTALMFAVLELMFISEIRRF